MVITSKLMTADEFFEWSNRLENRDNHYELERGEIIEVPPPGERHGVVCGNGVWVLSGYVRQRRRGYICSNDSGIILERDPDTVRGPDVVLYDEVRRYDQLNPRFTDRLPRLLVEVLSPGDRIDRVTRRITHFLSLGVPLIWVVDPEARDVTIFRPGQEPYTIEGDHELTGDDVLPDFRYRVADIFAMPGE